MQSMVIRVPELTAADHDPTDVLQEPQRNGGRLPQRARGRTDGVWAARDADSGRRGVLSGVSPSPDAKLPCGVEPRVLTGSLFLGRCWQDGR